jgi:hypothetical protein
VEEGDKEWTKRHSAELNEVESFLHGMVRKARPRAKSIVEVVAGAATPMCLGGASPPNSMGSRA